MSRSPLRSRAAARILVSHACRLIAERGSGDARLKFHSLRLYNIQTTSGFRKYADPAPSVDYHQAATLACKHLSLHSRQP
ncbi:hypothetical protein [Bradyrhizobium sp. LHD-71]|uniref:hypothetical protein n=1 Tax=Bradyrhizobium sp. LHD-71 TaxID=3072141 RepID=UPI00281014D1|nr:hypothetical protein [Bradyrhizobium sp. LHD-71]MDQ8732455.1 hypothetical protein [Bradyrhizobium sp. LHD-71]